MPTGNPIAQGVAGAIGGPVVLSKTNSILQSRNFGTTWSGPVGGTGTEAQDQDGIDGVANKAWTLNDTDAAAAVYWTQPVTIPDDSNPHTTSIFILKDSDETRFPEVRQFIAGGTAQFNYVQINTQTGASAKRASAGTVSHVVESYNDLWWRLILTCANNSTGNVTLHTYIHPANGNTLGGNDVSATGSIVIDQAQLELNTSIPSEPIVTTTKPVTKSYEHLKQRSR